MLLESLEENWTCIELKVARGGKVNVYQEDKCLLLLRLLFWGQRNSEFEKDSYFKTILRLSFPEVWNPKPLPGLPRAGPARLSNLTMHFPGIWHVLPLGCWPPLSPLLSPILMGVLWQLPAPIQALDSLKPEVKCHAIQEWSLSWLSHIHQPFDLCSTFACGSIHFAPITHVCTWLFPSVDHGFLKYQVGSLGYTTPGPSRQHRSL